MTGNGDFGRHGPVAKTVLGAISFPFALSFYQKEFHFQGGRSWEDSETHLTSLVLCKAKLSFYDIAWAHGSIFL